MEIHHENKRYLSGVSLESNTYLLAMTSSSNSFSGELSQEQCKAEGKKASEEILLSIILDFAGDGLTEEVMGESCKSNPTVGQLYKSATLCEHYLQIASYYRTAKTSHSCLL